MSSGYMLKSRYRKIIRATVNIKAVEISSLLLTCPHKVYHLLS